ncbi:MAG: RsiV family protein [Gammaproteobacteria bacterium]
MKKILLAVCLSVMFYPFVLATPLAPGLTLGTQSTLESIERSVGDNNHNTQITLHYPQIRGPNLSNNAFQFNQTIQNWVKTQISQFNQTVNANKTARGRNVFSLNYQASVIQPGNHQLISVVFTTDTMVTHAAHPAHTVSTFNYDLTAAKILTLDDLFEPHSGSRSVIENYVRTALKQRFPDLQPFEEGLEPSVQNYSAWSLKAAELVIHFNEAQVAPRVYGTLEVAVPYSALKEVPLSPLMSPCLKLAGCAAPSN